MAFCRLEISGIVQGVGFRPFLKRLADQEKINGYCFNHSAGVQVWAQGSKNQIENFIRLITEEAPPLAQIYGIEKKSEGEGSFDSQEKTKAEITSGFFIRDSIDDQEHIMPLIAADVALCARCRQEMLDSNNRRYQYPFTHCTDCGPRFTIMQSYPYDRVRTSMKYFTLCEDCQTEYDETSNIRFHAQPIACPQCGPKLYLKNSDGKVVAQKKDALFATAQNILQGKIVALKGMGGYHLACLADNEAVVQTLRRRKKRDSRPFAVMFSSLEHARQYAYISAKQAELLNAPSAPIVLCAKKNHEFSLAASTCLTANEIGVLLPYSGMHQLLLQACARPLVMTSANFSQEAIVYQEDMAQTQLKDVADFFLHYNRDIVNRCDDSVLRVFADDVYFIRRSRGYAPLPLKNKHTFSQNILALGGDEKNTFAYAHAQTVWLSQHIGNLQKPSVYDFFLQNIEQYRRLFSFQEDVVVSDLHPQYVSFQAAQKIARQKDIPHIQTQHHHAHLVSCLTDNQIFEPVIGLALDGNGLGNDHTLWGGEILIADRRDFLRVALFTPFLLTGGESAIHQPWKIAYSLLRQAGIKHEEILQNIRKKKVFSSPLITEEKIALLQQVYDKKLNSPVTSSLGRLFDGVSALSNLVLHSSYSGDAAIALENSLYQNKKDQDTNYSAPYTINIKMKRKFPLQMELDWTNMLRQIWFDVLDKKKSPDIAAQFHAAVLEVLFQAVEMLRQAYALKTVAMSGGVFLNRFLLENLSSRFKKADYLVCTHRQVPCTDGGLSLGQLHIADSILKGERSCVWQFPCK